MHIHGRGSAETAGQLVFNVARKLVVVVVAAALCFESTVEAAAQAPIQEATRVRVRALQASGDRIEITLVDRTILRGRIIRTEDDFFTLSEEKACRNYACSMRR